MSNFALSLSIVNLHEARVLGTILFHIDNISIHTISSLAFGPKASYDKLDYEIHGEF
jgi:hypothetical protein